jgi:CYTH domain-containing protein
MRDTSAFINPSAPPGKSQRYARPERERRFLLARKPPGAAHRTTRIVDRYLSGTRVRLRQMIETQGASTGTYYKLTQKVPAHDGGPGLLSTIYLNATEYALLATLPAELLCKTRHSVPPFGVDEFEGPLSGLFIAEAEFDDDVTMNAFNPPSWIVAEVTLDSRFTGGRLITTRSEDLAGLLSSFGLHPSLR